MDSGRSEIHSSSRRRVQVDSPQSEASTINVTNIHRTELAKELMKLIPRYDGTGEAQKLIEYIEENSKDIRDKLRNLKQKGTVKEYNAAFRRLAMQLTDMNFAEEKYTYLLGLNPRIKELVRTKDNITTIRALQNACISLESRERRISQQNGQEALNTESTATLTNFSGDWSYRC